MLGPHELMDKVMEYAQKQEFQGQFILSKDKLWNHILKIDPEADIRNMYEIIRELDARSWLLENSETEIEFDPACF
ncbi:hypothetical protein [Draconibacterium orientale]|uniref:hypothetical protein n=1 Tax=Draconibacterium orientale TaxID=1168034 RepID=UPI002AAB60BA|nr:hypothetical protein [Draconibacterium orientale]